MTTLNTPEARRAAFAAQQHQRRAIAAERLEQSRTRLDKWVLAAILLERFLTRFFSDKLALLPGWANFLDYPLLILFAMYVFATSRERKRTHTARGSGFELLTLALVVNILISALFNLDRLHPGAFFLFIVGFLEPLAYMLLAYALTPRLETFTFLVKILFFVGWLQIAVVLLVDFPQFLVFRNPDVISGTFGENPYQMVFYLLTWNVLVLSSKPPNRLRVLWLLGVSILQGVILAVILLAQFRAIIPFAAVTWALTSFLITRRRSLAIVAGGFSLAIFTVFFLGVNYLLPELKYNDVLQLTERRDEFVASGKVQAVFNFMDLVAEQPQVLVFGTGPGTYASRGFRTFSIAGKGDVANQAYRKLFNSDYYATDVATKYVLPTAGMFAFGASSTAVPWFSFLALPAELGLPGLFLVLVIYGIAVHKSWPVASHQGPVQLLARWVIVAMLLLMQMAFLENWLENSRLTVPVWTIFGVVLAYLHQTKEVTAVPKISAGPPVVYKFVRNSR